MTDLREVPDAHPEPGESDLAGLWSSTLQTLVGRVAHELNNTLNGALVNVAVVQARARPGADAGLAASFADAAAEQLEATATLVAGLLVLGRAPRPSLDAADVVRHTAALLAPAAAHDAVRLDVSAVRPCPVGGDPVASRLAICATLLAVADAARAGVGAGDSTVETAGPESANAGGESVHLVRCMTEPAEPPTLVIAPRSGATLDPAVARAIAAAGITVTCDADAIRLAFPPPATSY